MERPHDILLAACLLIGWHVSVCVAADPFADLDAATERLPAVAIPRAQSPVSLIWRRELYLLGALGREADPDQTREMLRSSAGFEIQSRFSSATRTFATINYQGRLVYRHHPRDLRADPMGREADRWSYETHNAYADLLNLLGGPGRFNLRVGHFYQPFGLNQQTDTHGTLLQLSNDQVLGSEHDWQITAFGGLSRNLDYTLGWLAGSGHDWDFEGQAGLAVARLALSADWLYNRGLEGGLSAAGGERYAGHPTPPAPHTHASEDAIAQLWRIGADLRKRINTAWGALAFTGEVAGGEEDSDPIVAGLMQGDWLHPGRRWGAALQYADWRRRTAGAAPLWPTAA